MQKQPRGTGITGTAGLLSCCAALRPAAGGDVGVGQLGAGVHDLLVNGGLGQGGGVHLVRGAVGVADAAGIVAGLALAGERILQQLGKGLVLAGAGTLDALAAVVGVFVGVLIGNVVGEGALLLIAAAKVLGRDLGWFACCSAAGSCSPGSGWSGWPEEPKGS